MFRSEKFKSTGCFRKKINRISLEIRLVRRDGTPMLENALQRRLPPPRGPLAVRAPDPFAERSGE